MVMVSFGTRLISLQLKSPTTHYTRVYVSMVGLDAPKKKAPLHLPGNKDLPARSLVPMSTESNDSLTHTLYLKNLKSPEEAQR